MTGRAWLHAALALLTASVAAVVIMPGAAWAATYDPTRPEGNRPYAQPADANVPVRGCQTTAADPANPSPSSPKSVQIIYAWHVGNGDHYSSLAQYVAKKVDRIDWMLDESSNYDQHLKLSCRYTPNGTYADYAQALVAKVQVPDLNPGGEIGAPALRSYLQDSLGFKDPNRVYVVFADFNTETNSLFGLSILDEWTAGAAFHELLHDFGAGHAWSTENGIDYNDDVMLDTGFWALDQDFNSQYAPHDLTTTFYTAPFPSTARFNIAADPALTTPTCCDIGYSNDLLTAQERTVEADAPWATPTGFSVSGGGWIQVTPPGPPSNDNTVSARYYDGRRSLTMNVQSYADGIVSVARKLPVTASTPYHFYARITTNTSGNVKLRISWYTSTDALISNSDSTTVGLTSAWEEYDLRATAPANAAKAQVSVISPAGQTFSYVLDTLNFMQCNNPNTADGCRNTY